MADAPVIIEAALNGITSRRHNPHVPVSPEELAAAAIECIDAGATIVHTHTQDPAAPATEPDRGVRRAATAPSSQNGRGTILYPTTGLGTTVADRYAHVGMLASEGLIRASFVDPGSVNLGGTGRTASHRRSNTSTRTRSPTSATRSTSRTSTSSARASRSSNRASCRWCWRTTGRRAPGGHARQALLRRRWVPHPGPPVVGGAADHRGPRSLPRDVGGHGHPLGRRGRRRRRVRTIPDPDGIASRCPSPHRTRGPTRRARKRGSRPRCRPTVRGTGATRGEPRRDRGHSRFGLQLDDSDGFRVVPSQQCEVDR